MRRVASWMFLALFLPVGTAWACSCIPPDPPLVELEQSDAVFKGVVTQVTQVPDRSWNVKIAVTGTWKGVASSSVDLFTYDFSVGCGYPFSLGQEYLVYANNCCEGCCLSLETSICTRTKRVSDAQEDFDALGPPNPTATETATWSQIKVMY